MGINFGNYQKNTFLVSNNDGYEEYRGLGADDVYNVYTLLTDHVKITDSQGINSIILGNAEIESTDFVSTGVIFHYASGGSLTVIGDIEQYTFVFGGGTDPFNPVLGGTGHTFNETVQLFGVDPANLSLSVISHGTVSGTIQDDGSLDSTDSGDDFQTIILDGKGSLTEPVTLDAAQENYLYVDNSNLAENVIIQNFSSNDHLQINKTPGADYAITNDGSDVWITYNPMIGEEVIQIVLEGVASPEDIIWDEASFESVIGFDAITFTTQNSSYTEIALNANGSYQAQDGLAEAFVYEFIVNSGGRMEGRDGAVSISGFDSEEDIIRFLDKDGNPPSQEIFKASGYSVTPNAFDGETVISLVPDSSHGAPIASDIVLQGIISSESEIQIDIV